MITTLVLLFITILTINSQDAAAISINNIHLPFNNRGILADVNYGSSGSMGRYPGPTGKGFLFSGGFYLSGYADTTLWTNAVASASLVQDYLAGLVGSNPEDEKNIIYKVGVSDPEFGESWLNWQDAVELGAYYYDGDNNGKYQPVDKNGNGSWDGDEDKPHIIYDENYFLVINDGVPADERRYNEVNPLGIEIRQYIFASSRNSLLKNVVFIRYSIVYRGFGESTDPDSLSNVIFTVWNDCDLGGTSGAASDDLVGCDTSLQAGYFYNDGEDDDWGVNPPSVFKVILQGPIVETGIVTDYGQNKFGPELGTNEIAGYKNLGMTNYSAPHKNIFPLPDPHDHIEARNYMESRYPLGDEVDPCTFEFGEVHGDVNCENIDNKFWYSGDPVTDYGWLQTKPVDMRDMVNTGTFTLHKNEPQDIIVAYVVGQGTDHLNSITKAREITQYVHEEYERNFSTIVGVDDEREEVVNSFSLSQNYPNPFNPTTTIKFTIPNVRRSGTSPYNTKLIVYDILGQQVKTLVNEIREPGSYEVTFDASRLASGVYFYRLTSGDFMQTKKMMLIK